MISHEYMLGMVSKININEELRLGNMKLTNNEDRQRIKRTLVMKNNEEIDLDILKAYLEAEKEHGDTEETLRYQALQLKYKALTTVPTTIEKTMTSAQLYISNSPLWTVELSANEIESFLDIEKNTGRLSEELFARTYAYETNQTYIIDTETFDSPYLIPNLKKG